MSRFNTKPVQPKIQVQVDLYQDFQGSKAELMFIKFSAMIANYRKGIFISLGVISVIVLGIVLYGEYHLDQVQKGTIALEEIQRKNALNPGKDLNEMLAEYGKVRKDFAVGEIELRTAKVLADLHARNGEFARAAELMEKAGKNIDELREIKAYYFYIAGNYREQAKDIKKSLIDYETASKLLNNMRNVPTLMAWSYFQTGRLLDLNGEKEKAKEYLRKILELDGKAEQFLKVRELATYLLLKINQS